MQPRLGGLETKVGEGNRAPSLTCTTPTELATRACDHYAYIRVKSHVGETITVELSLDGGLVGPLPTTSLQVVDPSRHGHVVNGVLQDAVQVVAVRATLGVSRAT